MVEESELRLGNGKWSSDYREFYKMPPSSQTNYPQSYFYGTESHSQGNPLSVWHNLVLVFLLCIFSKYFTCVHIFCSGMQKVSISPSGSMNHEGLCFSEVPKAQRSLLRARNQWLHHGSMFVSKNPALRWDKFEGSRPLTAMVQSHIFGRTPWSTPTSGFSILQFIVFVLAIFRWK